MSINLGGQPFAVISSSDMNADENDTGDFLIQALAAIIEKNKRLFHLKIQEFG
jgi:hypothetical protein